MNERIRELAEQATSIVDVKHEGYRGKGYTEQVEFFDKEKFAELIVLECAQVADIKGDTSAGCGYVTYTDGQRIKKHFGVDV